MNTQLINKSSNHHKYKGVLSKSVNNKITIVSLTKDADISSDTIRNLHGIIYHNNNPNKIIANNIPITIPSSHSISTLKLNPQLSLKCFRIREFIDGVSLRLYFNGVWHIATKRSTNATAKYKTTTDETLNYLFKKYTENAINYRMLNIQRTYYFIASLPEVTKSTHNTQPIIYYSHSSDNKKLNENDYTPLSEAIELKMPKEYIFNTYEEITDALTTLKMPDIGFIIHAEENLYITLETEEYKSLSKYNTPR